jgi:hypothetical protein
MNGHIPGIKKHPHGSVVAVCDTNQERANALAASNGISTVYTNWRDIIADPNIDAVTVALPNALHAEVTIAAPPVRDHAFRRSAAYIEQCVALSGTLESALSASVAVAT